MHFWGSLSPIPSNCYPSWGECQSRTGKLVDERTRGCGGGSSRMARVQPKGGSVAVSRAQATIWPLSLMLPALSTPQAVETVSVLRSVMTPEL